MTQLLGALASQDLIDELNKLYPNRCIQRGQSLDDAHAERGQRELIDKLQSSLDDFEANQKVL